MAVVALQPITLKAATLTIEADDYTSSVSEVAFIPEVDYEWLPVGFGGQQVPRPSGTRWVAQVGYAQDYDTAESLARYLVANAGQERAAVFTPRAAAESTITATLLILPGRMGGSAEQILTASVTLPLSGSPVLV